MSYDRIMLLLVFSFSNMSITSSKEMELLRSFSIESKYMSVSLCSDIFVLKYVLILFKAEKDLSQ